MDLHLEQLIKEYKASGLSDSEARMAARREFGPLESTKEECRDVRRVSLIENTAQDVRYAIRTLKKTPAFTGVVVATLALGIGGLTAVFSVVQAVLLAPLPYEAPGELVRVYQHERNDPSSRFPVSARHFQEIRDHGSPFEGVVAVLTSRETGLDLSRDARSQDGQHLRVLRVTSGYFRTLRAGTLRGREFERQDETGERLVVLSDPLWRNRFHADPSVVGQTIHLSARPYVVVGVAPAGFKDPVAGDVDAWEPYNLASDTDETNNSLTVIGRLRNGLGLAQARADLAALSQALDERWPRNDDNRLVVEPLKEDLVADSRRTLNVLTLAVVLVLMVACLNVANLFLVRATGRVREFAIRAALGSGGVRIARQLLVESVLLATAGGLAGLALGGILLGVLRAFGAEAIPRFGEVDLDPMVLGVTAVVTLATGLAFGMAPALRFARIHPNQALHQQSRSATGDRGQGRLRSGLAVLQVASALVLLVNAGILTASFYRLRQIDFGFRVNNVLTFELTLPSARYNTAQRAAFPEELARRIETIPGVIAAGGASQLPATGDFHSWRTTPLTGPQAGTDIRIESQQRVVSGDFFAALDIPVLAGRVFDARDDGNAPMRAVVSADFVRQAFPGVPIEGVVGQRIRILAALEREIIGVVGDVKLDAHGTAFPAVYHAHRQFAGHQTWALMQVVATELPPEQILAAVRAEVAALDPQLVVFRAAPMAEVVGRGVARERFALALMGAFAFVAVALAAIGLYGVLAYSVRQRTLEFGIRMALGAPAAHVRGLVLRHAAVVVAVGVAIGLAGALMIGRWLSSLVYETSPRDLRVLVATTLLLIVVSLLSAWFPAWRASRVEPRIAMHEE
jgi:predicted permease